MPVPPTGTFKVYPLSIATVDAVGFARGEDADNYEVDKDNDAAVAYFNSGGNPNATTITGPTGDYVWPFNENGADGEVCRANTYILEMFPDTSQIIFNPGGSQQIVDILSGDFPAGFAATNIKVRILWFTLLLSGVTNYCEYIKLLYFGGVIKTILSPDYGPFLGPTQWIESDADAIVPVGTYFGAAQTFKKFGFQLDFSELALGLSNNAASFFVVEMTGDYITDSSQIVTATPTSNLNAGDEVTITDPQKRMQDVRNIYLETTIGNQIVRTLVTITFISVDGGTIRIRLPRALAGNGTDELIASFFTGEVSLAILSPQLVDGSGIYKITVDKTDDTYYDRADPVDPTTVDMKIPTPFGRTGFF